jgi:hypothetical protein
MEVRYGATGLDSHAYWSAWRHHLYAAPPQSRDAYNYSPAFAEAFWPLTLIPWSVFGSLWLVAVAGIYLWLLAPLPLGWRLIALLACSSDIVTGNVWSLFGLVLVLGFRYPGAWAFPALTKVTPVLGPVWFAARREWRQLGVCVLTTAVVVAASFLASPHLWVRWFEFLSASSRHLGGMAPPINPPTRILLAIELPIAVGLTVFAARTNRRWLLPIAMLFANPVLTANAAVVLAAVPRLRAADRLAVARANSNS